MKKAIQVTNPLDVEELNKLFEQGYTVESADERGIYILKRDELNEKTVQQIRKSDTKQPQIRIEFDDIRDVPKVWVDGERDYDYNNKHTIAIIKEL